MTKECFGFATALKVNNPKTLVAFFVCDSIKKSAKAVAAFDGIIDANNYAMKVKGKVRMGFFHCGVSDTDPDSLVETF